MLTYEYPSHYLQIVIDGERSRVQTIHNCEQLLKETLPPGTAERLKEIIEEKQ